MKNLFLFLALFLLLYSSSAVPQGNTPVLEGTHNNAYTLVEPPSIFKYRTLLGKTATSDFQISYENPAPPYQAQTAIEYAVNIWEFLINSGQTIKINIKWEDLGYSSTSGYTLAKCGPDTFYNSPSLPEANVQYPIALAEHLLGQNLNGSNFDIRMSVNSNDSIDWYFGTDGIPHQDKNDMVSVILHEIAHGLGYIGFFAVNGNYGYRGISGIPLDTNSHPSIYDTYGALASYYPALDFLIDYPNHSTELKSKLTSNSVYFSGDNSWIQNGHNILPKIYAPASWKTGSSIFHLDDVTYPQGNSNSLMTHQLDNAEVIHSPGEVGLAILQDIGWSINRLATFIHPEPGVALQKGAIDTIKWTDNEGGSYNLVLLDSIDNFIMTVCTLGTADEGLNKYVWTVPSNVLNGKYQIKVQFGGAFGITNLFTITNQQQVAAPVFTPPPGTYPNPISITASCPTPGATIRYTTNGTEPDSNSPVFPASLPVSTFTTIKAKAFKTGMLPSLTTVATYSIGVEVSSPEISPVSGTYASEVYLEITCPDPAAVIRYNWGYDPNNPPSDPDETSDRWDWNPGTGHGLPFLYPTFHNLIVKAKTYRSGYVPSPVISATYQIIQGVNIKQLDASGTPFGQAAYWNTSQWNYVEPDEAVAMENNKKYFLSSQTWKPNTYQKFNYWEDNLNNKRYRNWDTLTIKSTTTDMFSYFQPTYNGIVIRNDLELSGINGGSVEFMDPWLVDINEPPYGNRSRGMDALFLPKTSPFNPNDTSIHKGVFLNQPIVSGKPYYKVGMPTEQPITVNGQNRKFFPYKWTGNSGVTFQNEWYRQTGVVFTSSEATATAVLKGQLMSNDQNGISSGSQRKLVRTDNGLYHVVYESIGCIWYSHSLTTSFTGSWSQDEQIEANSKNPAIDYEGNNIKIVYETTEPTIISQAAIFLKTYVPVIGGYQWESEELVAEYSYSYFGNAKPVISYDNLVVFIAYRKDISGGIYQMSKWYSGGSWNWGSEGLIPNTNSYSTNPAVAGKANNIYFAYEHYLSIKYIFAYHQSQNWQYSNYTTISKGSGYDYNQSPSVSVAGNLYPVVSWIGHSNIIPPYGMEKGNSENSDEYIPKVVVRRGGYGKWSSFFKAGKDAITTNNNSVTGSSTEATIITWSEGTSPENSSKWVRRTNGEYTDAHSLSHHGKQNQVSNGTSLQNMEGSVFAVNTTPYIIHLTNTDFSEQFPDGGGFNKTGDILALGYGREGVINKNGVEFLFNVGDIIVGDSVVKFIDQPDTIEYTSAEELNQVVKTIPFYLSPSTEFFFTDFYYVLNDSLADTALTELDLVTFKVELVNEQTEQVVGTFDEVTYTKQYLDRYANVSYQVNCDNISPGDYYLRLISTVEGSAEYYLGNVQNSGEELNKRKYQQVNFNGTELPVAYELEQNYPNPFNPATTIKFQIPSSGDVKLKVYDILGNEITTLVDNFMETGKYEVNFNARNLASGVYIYRLNVNDYVNVKKMMLLK